MNLNTEVCVIGAGPAGATFSTRMAQFGHDVLLIERSRFPRAHVGEAMTPAVWELLAISGARSAVEALEVMHSTSSRVRWIDDREELVDPPSGRPGFTVDRSQFDVALLETARAAGVTVIQPAHVSRLERTESGWKIAFFDNHGAATVKARFLADASGRTSRIPSRRCRTSPQTIALDALWSFEQSENHETRIEAGPDGWYWGAYLPGQRYRVMAFVDPDMLRMNQVAKPGLADFYFRLLSGSRMLGALKNPRLEGGVAAHDATCYFDTEPIDGISIKLGEAAFAIDPLSSSGVQKALQTALAGSIAVNTILGDGNEAAARAFYMDNHRRSVMQHSEWAASHYREHRRYRTRVFWERRARPAIRVARPHRSPNFKSYGGEPVQFGQGARVVQVPCAIGDHVEIRGALGHPNLARPIAFLNGVDLAVLIGNLTSSTSAQSLGRVSRWTQEHNSIISWLVSQGVLETVIPGVSPSLTSV